MGGLALLEEAAVAGLSLAADGDRLVIEGPSSADAVARRLLSAKAEVMAALAAAPPSLTLAAWALAVTAYQPLDPEIAASEASKYSRSAIVARVERLRAQAGRPEATALDQVLVADWQAILAAKDEEA